MTDHKDLKHHVRERMEKTGERYAAARVHVLAAREPDRGAKAGSPGTEPAPTTGALPPAAGFREETFFRFFGRQDPRSHEILAWCRDFASRFDRPGELLDACAALMADPLEKFGTEDLRLSRGSGPACLVGDDRVQDPPGLDHVQVWECDGKPVLVTSEPYELDMAGLSRLIAWCRRHGVTFRVGGGSWHLPGSTILVEFERKPKEAR